MRDPREIVSNYKRFKQLLSIATKRGSGIAVKRINATEHLPVALKAKAEVSTKPNPQVLRETLEEMGTTFIKFGQLLSERPDIVPKEYTEELKKLQDDVQPFTGEKARQIVSEEVGLDNLSSFDEKPMASASIAQVHTAKSVEGEELAIKIRRPGIEDRVENDLEIIRFLSKEAEKHIDKAREIRLSKLVEEFAEWTKQEIDLRKELRNGQEFKTNNADREKIEAPKFYEELSTEKVLVMEKVDGFKVTNKEKLEQNNISAEEVSERLVSAGLRHYIEDGFFHADPHPSNFFVKPSGDICYIDFGIMGRATKTTRIQVGLLLTSVINEDIEGATKSLEKIGYKSDSYEREKVKQEVEKRSSRIRGSTVNSGITDEVFRMILNLSDYGLHVPNKTILMGKSMATVEGIGKEINPDYGLSDDVYRKTMNSIKSQIDIQQEAQKFTADLIRNRQVIENLPSRLAAENQNTSSSNTKVNVQTKTDIKTPLLILGITYLVYLADLGFNKTPLFLAAILVSSYFILNG